MTEDEILGIHATALSKGFYDSWQGTPEDILAKLALIHSEVSEILEAYRKSKGKEAILEEFADVFIRCYDLIVALYNHDIIDTYDIDAMIRQKMAVNAGRSVKHGNLI
jgi:NTP pyrophosphatase (non-canonical NTP hydrolase)